MSGYVRLHRTTELKWEILQKGMKRGNVSEICRNYRIAPTLYYRWKNQAKQQMDLVAPDNVRERHIRKLERSLAKSARQLEVMRIVIAGISCADLHLQARQLLRQGYNPTLIANALNVSRSSLYYENRGRSVLKKVENPSYKEAVLATLHCPPAAFGINRTTWTVKLLSRVMTSRGYVAGHNTVSKIIKNAGYKFRKAKEVLTSNDPHYREKLGKITYILAHLGPKDRFFSIDEFGPFAVKKRGGRRLVPANEYPTIPQWQRSKGFLIVTAALELSQNQLTHFFSKKKDSGEMIKLLEMLLDKYDGCRRIYFSWDAASWHASKLFLARVNSVNGPNYRKSHNTPIVRLAALPARAQFLNVIESVFSGMAKAIIHNSDYESVDDAMHAVDRYFRERNEHFAKHPRRAGQKIWGKEIVASEFREGQNCKDAKWR